MKNSKYNVQFKEKEIQDCGQAQRRVMLHRVEYKKPTDTVGWFFIITEYNLDITYQWQ